MLAPNSEFWAKQRVLVTGGHGFLGSHLLRLLDRLGASVVAPTHEAFDLVRANEIDAMLDKTEYTLVLHLAGRIGGIGDNRAHPAGYFYDTVTMNTELLHRCWQRGVPKFVGLATVCGYPKFAPVPFAESSLWDGYPEETNAAYGLAKKMMSVQSLAYRQEHGYNSVVLYPVNLYGPNDNFDPSTSHVIPALIKKCLDAVEAGADEIVVWGDGSPTREFLYVEDAARAICLAAEHYNSSEPVNLGSGSEISIRDLVDTVARATNFTGHVTYDTTKPNGQPRRRLDVSKARQEFGFTASTSFDVGLERTVEWYRRIRSQPALVKTLGPGDSRHYGQQA
jgi:GDP-L-fucose synthase